MAFEITKCPCTLFFYKCLTIYHCFCHRYYYPHFYQIKNMPLSLPLSLSLSLMIFFVILIVVVVASIVIIVIVITMAMEKENIQNFHFAIELPFHLLCCIKLTSMFYPKYKGFADKTCNTSQWTRFVLVFCLVDNRPILPKQTNFTNPTNVSFPYPTSHHSVTEMCTCMHIFVTKRCTMAYFSVVWFVRWLHSSRLLH